MAQGEGGREGGRERERREGGRREERGREEEGLTYSELVLRPPRH